MAKIEKRIVIEKSSERIFNYVAEPIASSEIWPGLLEVREVQRAPDGLAFARWLYKLMGPLIEEWIIAAKFDADQRAFTGELCGLDCVMTWRYQSDRAGGPCLMLDGDHTHWSQS